MCQYCYYNSHRSNLPRQLLPRTTSLALKRTKRPQNLFSRFRKILSSFLWGDQLNRKYETSLQKPRRERRVIFVFPWQQNQSYCVDLQQDGQNVSCSLMISQLSGHCKSERETRKWLSRERWIKSCYRIAEPQILWYMMPLPNEHPFDL